MLLPAHLTSHGLKTSLTFSVGAVAEGAVGLWGGVKGWASDRLRGSRDDDDTSSDNEDEGESTEDRRGVFPASSPELHEYQKAH